MRRHWYLLLIIPAAAAIVVASILTQTSDAPPILSPSEFEEPTQDGFEINPAALSEEDAEIKRLETHASKAGARSTDVEFQRAMESASEKVRRSGFQLALSLAGKEGGEAPARVVSGALSNGASDLRRTALVEARRVKDLGLTRELLEFAKRPGVEGDLALDALALSGDLRAADLLCELASSGTSDRSRRIRAVALLSQLDDTRALEILRELAQSDDAELARVATAAIEALRARK
jgi:hypothetical protein